MTTISKLREGKSLNHSKGKIGEHWAKNGEKLPIVRHCRLDLTRSVRRDASAVVKSQSGINRLLPALRAGPFYLFRLPLDLRSTF
jgi:hypothetical protein